MKRRAKRITWGILLVIVAVLIIANQMGYTFMFAGLGWLSLLLLAGCVFTFISGIISWEPWSVLFAVAVGYYILSNPLSLPHISLWMLLLAAVIASCGISMIFGKKHKARIEVNLGDEYFNNEEWTYVKKGKMEDKVFSGGTSTSNDDYISGDLVFSGVTRYIESQQFRGGVYDLVFSHASFYFDHASLFEGKAVLKNDLVFSSLDLYIPKHWNVSDLTDRVFSGNDCASATGAENPTLTITGDCVWSSIRIHRV